MKFIGEHLLPGQLGHFFIILAFVSAGFAAYAFFKLRYAAGESLWLQPAKIAFLIHSISLLVVFALLFIICKNHYFEYMYAYKHASLELESKYLLACIWEGQEGSFLLWAIWQAFFGWLLWRKNDQFRAPVLSVISLAQFFLMMMVLGVYIGNIKIGNSPFVLTRNEINAPIFARAEYLTLIRDGMGLNVLLRNYWMVIHPPVLFMGFAAMIVPFAYAVSGLLTKRFGEWVAPSLSYMLTAATILGTGIMMGGKWAYESLSFGGYWAWDPVENASLVPWLILLAGLHTAVVFKATGRSLRITSLFVLLGYIFILYSTFLTRTGILGETSVHAFTEAGEDISFNLFGTAFSFKAMNALILFFLLFFVGLGTYAFVRRFKSIPAVHTEEETNTREFWMFIGSLILWLSAIFIIAKTSAPVYNKIFGANIAPPQDVEFSYNKVMVLVAVILGVISAFGLFLKFKTTNNKTFRKQMLPPLLVSIVLFVSMAFLMPFEYRKHGAGFLIAIYAGAFATIFAFVANGWYLFVNQKRNLLKGGPALSHAGFALMILGMLISSANKKVISNSMVNGITMAPGKDPMTKQEENPRENLTLLREVPSTLDEYKVVFKGDSLGNEKGRKFYQLSFTRSKDSAVKESFVLQPDVYLMKDNNMSSNPDTKSYLTKDVFTYITAALNKEAEPDTTAFREVNLNPGDTAFYSNGTINLREVQKDPPALQSRLAQGEIALQASLHFTAKDGMHYRAEPALIVDRDGHINYVDDTLYAQNLFLRFQGVDENQKIRIGIRESDRLIDYVTIKAYVFPYINLVWLGLIIMVLGMLISTAKRAGFSKIGAYVLIIGGLLFVAYMFLLANT